LYERSRRAPMAAWPVPPSGSRRTPWRSAEAARGCGPRLRCGVDIASIANFVTFLKSTKDYRVDFQRVEYGDERDPKKRAILERISPLTNAAKIKVPLFVALGKNDPRVPVTDAEQIVKTVREGGSPVWYIMTKDEGQGFQKKTNCDAFLGVTALF